MSEEKQGQCLPSQVTINIGTSGVKINDGGQPPAPAVDLTKYVTREAAESRETVKGPAYLSRLGLSVTRPERSVPSRFREPPEQARPRYPAGGALLRP